MRVPKPHDLKKLPITKLDAARRQLETAITLWFHDADPVSVHTLVMAAHGILKTLNKKLGGRPMFGDPMPHIRPEFHERVRKVFVEASNFFKHGDKDPLATHFFAPESNEFMIWDACQAHQQLAHENRPLMTTFNLYFAHHNPDLLVKEYLDSLQQQEPLFSRAKQWSKSKFFAEFLPTASSFYATTAAAADE